MDKLTDNQFLFGFEGRINRFKYWYALFAGMISCLVFLLALALAIGVIFSTHVKSVDIQFFKIFGNPPSFPFSANFSGADPDTTALISILFHVAGTPHLVPDGRHDQVASRSQQKRLVDRRLLHRSGPAWRHRGPA